MNRIKTINRKKLVFMQSTMVIMMFLLMIRLSYLMVFRSEFLQKKADDLHNRERVIKARRGYIYDRQGIAIAINKPVTTISTIHNQIKEPEKVAQILSKELDIEYEKVKQKVDHKVALEKIKTNVDRDIADRIRSYDLAGVMVDEDYKRWYPYENVASHIIGFTGSDNQGIIGLEVKYEDYLKGIEGKILTKTDARGIEIKNEAESRIEPIDGNNLVTSIDINIQKYAEQALEKVLEAKEAKRGSLIIMNPQNGAIYAMVNKPDFNLNEPFKLNDLNISVSNKEKQILLNKMWRNYCINDTYEPGSTFKIVTAAAGLQEKVVKLEDTFHCPGYRIVEDRRIRCHKSGGHGTQTFLQGVQNSCNPVFMEVAERLGVSRFYDYFKKFGFFEKTGVDLPGEAIAIMHKKENIGPVELATLSFGQSFQITPLQLVRAASAVINGGKLVTPHLGLKITNEEGKTIKKFKYNNNKMAINKETSLTMTKILESVVSEGTGRRSYLPGYKLGGKTATSEKLPRSSNKYISSFLGFAPADSPKVVGLVLIDEPVGIYYGGTVAAPIIKEVFENTLPYLKIKPNYSELDIKKYNVGTVCIPNLVGNTIEDAKEKLKKYELDIEILGQGLVVKEQFPLPNEFVNNKSKLILYAE